MPLGQTETFEYDDRGRQVRKVDFEGRIMDSVFSDDGFLDELFYHDAGSNPDVDTPDETVEYEYDAQGRKISTTDDRGTTEYEYDLDGHVTRIDSPEGVINYEYDETTGRLMRTFVGADAQDPLHDTEYAYDGFGRLKTVSVVERNDVVLSTPEVTTYTYDLVGNLVSVDQANGVISVYTYDDLNRLDVLTHYAPDGTPENLADNAKVAEFDYTVRADGKRTAATEIRWQSGTPLVITISWAYDNLGRLVEEDYDHHQSGKDFVATYTYDLVGNRLVVSIDRDGTANDEVTTSTFDANDRLLVESIVTGQVDTVQNGETNDATRTYEYGGPSNPGTEQTRRTVTSTLSGAIANIQSFGYDLQGRMDEVVVDTYTSGNVTNRNTTTFEYDDSGMRVQSTNKIETDHDSNPSTPLAVQSETEVTDLVDYFNFTGYPRVIEEITRNSATQAIIQDLVFAIGHQILSQTNVDPSQAGTNASSPLYFLYDGHGSTRLLLTAAAILATNGSSLQAFDFDAYGRTVSGSTSSALTNILYSGEWYDKRFGQSINWNRWYDFRTGRWNRMDPLITGKGLQDPQSLHKYGYVHGDPINFFDPTGLAEATLASSIVTAGLKGGLASVLIMAPVRAYRAAKQFRDNVAVHDVLREFALGTLTDFGVGFAGGAAGAALVRSFKFMQAMELVIQKGIETTFSKIRNASAVLREGTQIPKYFELATRSGPVFIKENATKHVSDIIYPIVQKAVTTQGVNNAAGFTRSASAMVIESLEFAVGKAMQNPTVIKLGQPFIMEGWELIIVKNLDQPLRWAVSHAVPIAVKAI